jgi:hypothetical protein
MISHIESTWAECTTVLALFAPCYNDSAWLGVVLRAHMDQAVYVQHRLLPPTTYSGV